eukprot:TRINITY_DN5275_c0_g1_i3.p2 TRINITY_DN5275_c0_g1~~TRINITY_DN5275_c0_g1_i3.p2  ORF type:complete len:108 (-),score=23.14 TRINITY_DN5275_c0_g1_i3:512-835(-)
MSLPSSNYLRPVHTMQNFMQKRFGHGHSDDRVVKVSPYRRPLVPPNRPLAFVLASSLLVLAGGLSGLFFYTPSVSDKVPEGARDRKNPKEKITTIDQNSVYPIDRRN